MTPDFSILGAALARVLSHRKGLNCVVLPNDLESAVSTSFVERFNELVAHSGGYPVAHRLIEVGHAASTASSSYDIDVNRMMQLRFGNRLVVTDSSSEVAIETIKSTFVAIVSADFPISLCEADLDQDRAPFSFHDLASQIVVELEPSLENYSMLREDLDLLRDSIRNCIEYLARSYSSSTADPESWNRAWFTHVDTALERLKNRIESSRSLNFRGNFNPIFATFALPQPSSGTTYKNSNGPSRFLDLIEENWSSRDDAERSVERLGGLSGVHPLSGIDWSELEGAVFGNSRHPIFRFASQDVRQLGGPEGSDFIDCFGALTEDQFFTETDPLSRRMEIEKIAAQDDSTEDRLEPLNAQLLADGLNILTVRAVDATTLGSEEVLIRIPVQEDSAITDEMLNSSSLTVSTAGRMSLDFVCSNRSHTDQAVELRGTFRIKSEKGKFKFPTKPKTVAPAIDVNEALARHLVLEAVLDLLIVPVGAGNLVKEVVQRGKPKPAELLPPEKLRISGGELGLDDPQDSEQVLTIPPACAVRLISFDGEIEGFGASAGRHEPRHSITVDASNAGERLTVGDVSYVIAAETIPRSVLSPVVAALRDQHVSLESAPVDAQQSLRGVIERLYTHLAVDSDGTREALAFSMGHVALLADDPSSGIRDPRKDFAPSPCGNFLLPSGLRDRWHDLAGPTVPKVVAGLNELGQFRRALEELDIERLLTFEDGEGDKRVVLPSQASLAAHGPDTNERIDKYLTAYITLVDATKKALGSSPVDQSGIFWASLPFTASIWRAHGRSLKCEAVLLSPLHPIRLAWLAGVEKTLRNASSDLKQNLGGLIEGWNLPMFCPTNARGKLIAVPSDNGPDDLFLGWTLMARVSSEDPTPISIPEAAGNLLMPGSATSGITRGGVTRAIRDYRATFPHITTLSIDLAASSSTPRLPEVDRAVIDEAGNSGKTGRELPGGIRVFDSLNRSGELPELERLQSTGAGHAVAPLVWTRYSNESGFEGPPPADIRILQDQGAALLVHESVSHEGSPAGGILASGLRRTELRFSRALEDPMLLAVGPESTSLLADAVRTVERTCGDHDLALSVDLPPDYFGSKGTRWTVSGETAIRPGDIHQLVSPESTGKVLWEWRPSFLDSADSSGQTFQRRPYVSFTDVSKALEAQIEKKLQAVDEYPIGDPGEAARQILSVLGKRGVGLSRLVAGKDERSIGAIGFALALQLAGTNSSPKNRNSHSDFWDFVFPIDVCEQYLRALAGDDAPDLPRKADLLLMRLSSAGRLQLCPIEVKVRQLETVVETFPVRDDSTLADAEDQVVQTSRLFASITRRFGEPSVTTTSGLADRELMAIAIGALLEACVSLRTEEPDRGLATGGTVIEGQRALRKAVFEVVSGMGSLEVARPVVLFIGNGANDDGQKCLSRLNLDPLSGDPDIRVGQFLVNAGALARELWMAPNETPIRDKWASVTDWAFDVPSPMGTAPTTQEPPVQPDGQSSSTEVQPETNGTHPTVEPAREDEGNNNTDDALDGESSNGEERNPEPAPVIDDASDQPSAANKDNYIVGSGIRFAVGSPVGSTRDVAVEFWPSNTALNQMNIGVIGDLGTGKTQLVKALVYKIRRGSREQHVPVSFLILDYKGDYKGEEFLNAVGGVTVGGEPIPLDLFHLGGEYSPTKAWRKARQFVDVIKRIWRGVGPVQSERLETAVTQLFEENDGRAPTLFDVADRYRDIAGGADSVTNVLSVLTRGGWFSGKRSELKPFADLLGNQVLVVSMDSPDMDDQTKNTIAALFLNLYRQHMADQKKRPFEGRDPQLRYLNSYILIDEAHNLMGLNFKALSEILLQGREFGVGVILSSQFLSHFKNSDNDYREPLLTWFIHKVPSIRAQELKELGMEGSEKLAETVPRLETSMSVYKSLGNAGAVIQERPFWRLLEEPDEADGER